MTLNGHFALKSVSDSASNGLAFWLLDKTVLKFADLIVHCQRQKCSADTLVTGDVSFMGLFYSLGFREELSRMLFTDGLSGLLYFL